MKCCFARCNMVHSTLCRNVLQAVLLSIDTKIMLYPFLHFFFVFPSDVLICCFSHLKKYEQKGSVTFRKTR